MFYLQQENKIDAKVLDNINLNIIYNFTYRLSGNRDVAEVLTEKVFINQPALHNPDDVKLLKQAWKESKRH